MQPQGIRNPESFAELLFPEAGIDLSRGYGDQRPKEMPGGAYGRTCRDAFNVRTFEPSTGRARGGSRRGLSKYVAPAVVADWLIQQLDTLVTVGLDAPGGIVGQQSLSGRVVNVVAVSQGNVYVAQPGATVWTAATNTTGATPPLNFTGILYSTSLNQKLWFADGVNWCYYDPSDNTVRTWAASVGSLPVDTRNNTPRLIENWRGRMVLSGILEDPQNWFMSKQSDPTNWDYGDPAIPPTMAIAGNNSPLGLVGDVINTLIPYNDDVLIFGGDHTIWLMHGDPMAGGQIDRVSDAIGMAWGRPWAKDPYGNVYFVSNKTGIYSMVPGQQPQRISQAVEQLLLDVDTGANLFRLAWNDRYQGLHVFISPIAAAGATTHLFYELRTGAWWQDEFGSTDYDPLCCCTFDGNTAADRVVLIGSWDGYVRSVDPDATTDDGTAIASSVVIGPLLTKDFDDVLIKDLQAILGTASGDVTYQIYTGATAEAALASTPVASGTWSAGRNLDTLIRRSAHALYVKITTSNAWSMEAIRARIAGKGKVRRRGY